jgi:hypothetical protein
MKITLLGYDAVLFGRMVVAFQRIPVLSSKGTRAGCTVHSLLCKWGNRFLQNVSTVYIYQTTRDHIPKDFIYILEC